MSQVAKGREEGEGEAGEIGSHLLASSPSPPRPPESSMPPSHTVLASRLPWLPAGTCLRPPRPWGQFLCHGGNKLPGCTGPACGVALLLEHRTRMPSSCHGRSRDPSTCTRLGGTGRQTSLAPRPR
eukprot:768213-Hanusia_phi.AAC.6